MPTAGQAFKNWWNNVNPFSSAPGGPIFRQSVEDINGHGGPFVGQGLFAIPNVQPTLESIASALDAMMQSGSNYSTPFSAELQGQMNDSVNNQNTIRARLGLVANQLDTISTDCSVIRASTDEGFGSLSTPDALDDIWSYTGIYGGLDVLTAVKNAGQYASTQTQRGLMRYENNPCFLVCWNGDASEFNYSSMYDFRSLDPASQPADQTTLEFLELYAPFVSWWDNLNGTPFTGCTQITSVGDTFDYYYVPIGVSPQDFVRAWNYTPSSGGDERNAISDFMKMMAMIPVQW